jgi:hypothetical protein
MINSKHRGRQYSLLENEYIMIVPEYVGHNPDCIYWEIWLPTKCYHDSKPYIEFESPSCHIDSSDNYTKLEQAIEVAETISRNENDPWYRLPIKVVDYSTFTEPMDLDDSIQACLILKYRSLELPDEFPLF